MSFVDSVDETRCLARTWNGGRGGQCGKVCAPGRDLCKGHAGEGKLGHGKVNGKIPEAKLREFLRAGAKEELKRIAKSFAAESQDEYDDYNKVGINYKNQWSQFSGAFKTYSLSLDFPILKGKRTS